MKTKDRILDAALKLMNANGLDNVSTYDIARELGIRQSNITYYFAAKADIVNALAKKMIVDSDAAVANASIEHFTIAAFYEMLDTVMKVHQKYKFILMNFAPIITADKELTQHYTKVLKGRTAQLEGIVTMLDANGYVRGKEMLPYAEDLMLMMNMTAIYWVQESAIYMAGQSDKAKRKHHLRVYFQAFIPYLTPKGLKELTTLTNN